MRWPTLILLLALLLGACKRAPARVPGETDIEVASVTLVNADGGPLSVETGDLIGRLGMRKRALLFPNRMYSEFREAEDRRRLEAFWQQHGFFDVKVAQPLLKFVGEGEDEKVEITWSIREGQRYRVASVELRHAPEEFEKTLEGMIDFGPGYRDINLERMRKLRVKMHLHLRNEGHGLAEVFSRTWVDSEKKAIHWVYYVDAGPKTRVGKIVVDGNVKVPDEVIKERVGLKKGDPYEFDDRLERETDLLDSGAIASSFIRTTPATRFLVPGDAPGDGGKITEDMVDEQGNFVGRELPEEVDLKIHVVEAPSQQVRVRAGLEFDPTRVDTFVGSRLWLRNLFGPFHHVTLDGRVGYGWLWRDRTDDPTGVYGDVTLRYTKAMAFARLVDFRTTVRYRDDLYPGFHLREFTAGPGIRAKLDAHLFLDVDTMFRFGQQAGFGPFSDAEKDAFSLAEEDEYLGAELQTSLILDERDNPVEAMEGYMLGVRSSFSPGGVDGWNRYLTGNPFVRGFIPLARAERGPSLSVAMRLEGNWAFLDDQGVPLGPRIFSGGSYRMRGFGRHRLSPELGRPRFCDDPNDPDSCDPWVVGGRSVVESSIELRWLPPVKPFGAVGFIDMGAIHQSLDPFANGVSLAAGLGLRLRLWYIPIALDFSYRALQNNEGQRWEDDPLLVFFRIGEAF